MWRYYQQHPEGPFVYGPWDSFPIWPDISEKHARRLNQYLPLVEEGTWAYLEIAESDFFRSALPTRVVASAFANLELYLVLANYGASEVRVETADAYVPGDERSSQAKRDWKLSARSFLILRRAASTLGIEA
jgi:hypothetical protein